jgi:hypothetical protein
MTGEFSAPVSIVVGLGFPARIRDVRGALVILDSAPNGRIAAHNTAVSACRDALAGRVEVEEARAAFLRFAQDADILLDATPVAPTTLPRGGRPRVPKLQPPSDRIIDR